MRFKVLLIVAMFFAVSSLASGNAHALALSNSRVSLAQISTLFDWNNRTEISNTFDFSPTDVGGDGYVLSGYAAGTGAATGLNLYFYKIGYSTTALPALRLIDLSLSFPDIVTKKINLNYTGPADSSYYVGPNTLNYPNAGANYNSGVIDFNFSCCNIIDPGETSTYFGAISYGSANLTLATLTTETNLTTTTGVLAPVPEPSTLLIIGSGLVSFGVFMRRRSKA